jgi:hypothetical protein
MFKGIWSKAKKVVNKVLGHEEVKEEEKSYGGCGVKMLYILPASPSPVERPKRAKRVERPKVEEVAKRDILKRVEKMKRHDLQGQFKEWKKNIAELDRLRKLQSL